MKRAFFSTMLMTLLAVVASNPSQAALYFWDKGGVGQNFGTAANWNPDGIPGSADLAVHNTLQPAIQITSNQTVDSLRLSDGGSVIQTGGLLTIANGVGPDNGLWVGEFGPTSTFYGINGGSIQIDDPIDGFMIGRGGGSNATFQLMSGMVTNLVGDTHIGLDGRATWNQSGGVANLAGVQVGRFQSPTATVNLSGTATWTSGLLLMSDGFLGSAVQSDFNIKGPNVSVTTNGLVMKSLGNLTFDGIGGGLSTLDLTSGIWLLDDAELYLSNLPLPSFAGQVLTLIDNIGSQVGPDAEFNNAPNGSTYGPWVLDYTGTQVNLVAVPEPTSAVLAFLSLALATFRRR
jgi:hypothetical protein